MGINAGRKGSSIVSAVAIASFAMLAEAVTLGMTARWDNAIRSIAHESAGPFLTVCATTVSTFGALLILLPATAAILAWLLVVRRRASALALGSAMGGALLLNWLLKTGIHRVRPQPYFGVDPDTFSFPSGHVFFAATFYGAVCLILTRHRKLAPLAITVCGLPVLAIAWSRVYLGVHYPSDVAAGFLLAIFWLGGLFGLGLFKPEN
jgi:membrane-associated phospholipid phosphatase